MIRPGNFLLHAYDLKTSTSLTPVRFLFNHAKNLRLQDAKNWRIYESLHPQSRSVKARIALHIVDDIAESPLRAPFGFMEIYEAVSSNELTKLLLWIEMDLKERGVERLQLKSYPEAYEKNFKLIETVIRELHYKESHEVSSIIHVDRKPFEKKIKISERQKLRKAEKWFSFQMLKKNQLPEVYSFIEACRKERDQHLSMSLPALQESVRAFPGNFFLYRVYDASETAAAAIVIKVNDEIWYTFYYAHARKFDKVSPVVFLLSNLYGLAQDQGIEMIDLGTSMINGKVNRSLIHFKKSIGGVSNRKLIFEKTLP